MKRALPPVAVVLFLGVGLTACSDQTSVLLNVNGPALASLTLDARRTPGDRTVHEEVTRRDGDSQIATPLHILISLPDEPSMLEVTLSAVDTTGNPLHAHAFATSTPHQQVALDLTLEGETPTVPDLGADLSNPETIDGAM
jgi:hypothetical protein